MRDSTSQYIIEVELYAFFRIGPAAPLGCLPLVDKDDERASRKCRRENTPAT
jgi:hypothetical protein